ncbi:pyrroline-5-carboxylate reductase [Treponema rectale]|uniref:Pyrroline-5-carboxylate reductase n=1 Tax=Treponema rectale TaxID=744512 RepID=A0A840SB85_9SPIR|nr:pyrroline-5-carboxylate reductase [Treponema rectale]MBB5219017.1 pyrroline-5-carboxylate reductase [Treponema rectale]QOS41071.1 pyrroline-5-carboxylate reductase [Treponema rectale]
MKTLGFIGMGNMAQALCTGFTASKKISASDIYAYAPNQEKLNQNAKKIGFIPCKSLKEVVSKSDTIIMACKPYQIEEILSEIKNDLSGKALISIALGWNYEKYAQHVNVNRPANSDYNHTDIENVRVQFVMPNTPAMVNEGVFLFEKSNSLKEDERKEIKELFACLGTVEELPDNLMGIGGAVTGCGPAFVDLFLEAYADAAVKYGIPRTTAYKLVSQTVLGSAKLQLATGTHPAVLKDNVCSPAGSTIRGVTALEEQGLRNACIKSIDAIMNK